MSQANADVLIHSVRGGDATSQLIFDLARVLAERQQAVRICYNYNAAHLPADMQPLIRQSRYAEYTPAADLTILQYPIWFPLAERFRQASGKRLFWYHGVTPPALWQIDTNREALEIAEARRELVWHAQLAVATSPFTAQELQQATGYPRERIRIIPLVVPVERLQTPPAADELTRLRTQWKLHGQQILLYVGRIAGHKRIDLLVQALAAVRTELPTLHLLIVGDTQSNPVAQQIYAQLQRQIAELRLTERVTFTGSVAAVEPYYHLADLVVQASQHEGFGAPLIEAMAAGVPVIASASGAMPWVLQAESGESNAAGLTFPPDDVAALAMQIRRVLGEPALRAALIARGRRRVGDFSAAQFHARVVELLVELATLAQQPEPTAQFSNSSLNAAVDVALRTYEVHSELPLIGRWLAWLRSNSTTHLKEAYLDRIIERQVNFNRTATQQTQQLQRELLELRQAVEAMRQRRE